MVTNSGSDKVFNIIVDILLAIFALLILLPLVHVLSSSFSSPESVYRGEVLLLPKDISLRCYELVLKRADIWVGYRNTILYTVLGTLIAVSVQMMAGFALSRRDLPLRPAVNIIFILTMFVSGGMIPTYLVVKGLGLLNTMWAVILPGCISAYNIIIVRTFIHSSLPFELQEAAMIDGCGNLKMFFLIVFPLCMPIVAVMTLYAIVGYWNSYFNALIYITDSDKYTLQLVLQNILMQNETGTSGGTISGGEQALLSQALKYSTIVVSSLHILIMYPFFEKYFEKGMIVGSLKG